MHAKTRPRLGCGLLVTFLALAPSACSSRSDDGRGDAATDAVLELGDDTNGLDAPTDGDAPEGDDGAGDASADAPPDDVPDTAGDPADTAGDPATDDVPDSPPDGPGADVPDGDAADAVTDADEDGASSCAVDEDCAFGDWCDGDTCVPLECHLGDYALGLPDRPCPESQVCERLLDPEGDFACVAFSQSCDFPSECPFGFRCVDGSCALSGCTVGNWDANYGPRPCADEALICACMEDGADLNGGRGVCVADPDACP
jgi:hypothetical protein